MNIQRLIYAGWYFYDLRQDEIGKWAQPMQSGRFGQQVISNIRFSFGLMANERSHGLDYCLVPQDAIMAKPPGA